MPRRSINNCNCGCHWETVGNCPRCQWFHAKRNGY